MGTNLQDLFTIWASRLPELGRGEEDRAEQARTKFGWEGRSGEREGEGAKGGSAWLSSFAARFER